MNTSVAEARNKLPQLLEAMAQEPVVITSLGKPLAVLITAEEYAEMGKLRQDYQ